jgi:large subunit ribosomal protein L10e
MGNLKAEFDTEIAVISQRDIMVRHNSLEAARIASNKVLEDNIGISNYRMTVRVFPHHVLRENVMATGAGADRVQSGMRNSFGKPVGTAARVHCGQAVFSIFLNNDPAAINFAKKALKIAKTKLPGEMRIIVQPAAK